MLSGSLVTPDLHSLEFVASLRSLFDYTLDLMNSLLAHVVGIEMQELNVRESCHRV
jgi:hypothetical protein